MRGRGSALARESPVVTRLAGRRWTSSAIGGNAAWGTSAQDVFVVGDYESSIYHFDGDAWQTVSEMIPHYLLDVWGSSNADIFAVGAGGEQQYSDACPTGCPRGLIVHFDGVEWKEMVHEYDGALGLTGDLHGVWGSAANDVFAVGAEGTIVHYDGRDWSRMTSGTTAFLSNVAGSSSQDVFAVGRDGTIVRYDGSAWRPMSSGTTDPLSAVWARSAAEVFALGRGGLYRYGPTR